MKSKGAFRKATSAAGVFFMTLFPVFAQDLSLAPENIRIEEQPGSRGFHLYIQKKPDITSVLLTESTRDPAMRADNYALRSPEWNPINGDEIRLLNGVPIRPESNIHSLVSSTVMRHPELGGAFHIFIPRIVNYGYETGRHGELYITDGVYLNIRTFSLPYADYRGKFADNPFILKVVQKIPESKPQGNYNEDAVNAFNEIANRGKGDFIYASDSKNLTDSTNPIGPADLVEKINDILKKETGNSVDIVLCFDTTASMKPHIDEVRKKLIPMMKETIAGFKGFRIGMVLYKDYYDEYLNKVIPFTSDFNVFQRNLNAIQVRGGGDIPEAVYEALYEGADKFPWAAESRLLVLIGDAPPHPRQRGKISSEMVYQRAAEKGVTINAIILPE